MLCGAPITSGGARELCARHYQQLRRRNALPDPPTRRPRGSRTLGAEGEHHTRINGMLVPTADVLKFLDAWHTQLVTARLARQRVVRSATPTNST